MKSMPLVFLHRALAALLGLFVVSHFGAHLFAIGGPEAHNAALKSIQWVYRNRFVEPLLLVAIGTQIILGVRLVMRRWRQPGKGFWGWAQIVSGFYLIYFFLAHASAALMTRHVFNIDTNFYWPAGTLITAPLQVYFVPYYFSAALAFFTHIAAALHFRLQGKGGVALAAPPILMGAGALYGLFVLIVFSGTLFNIDLPPEYQDFFGNYPGAK